MPDTGIHDDLLHTARPDLKVLHELVTALPWNDLVVGAREYEHLLAREWVRRVGLRVRRVRGVVRMHTAQEAHGNVRRLKRDARLLRATGDQVQVVRAACACI